MRILRRRGDLVITETRHGFVCANSGVDLSNVRAGLGRAAARWTATARPAASATASGRALGVDVGVIVSATRSGGRGGAGLTDVAIGVAGIAGVVDLRGTPDALGRVMQVTEVAVADELAAAAELVMGKSSGIPVAVVRGVDRPSGCATPTCRRDRPPPARGPVPLAGVDRVAQARCRRPAASTAPSRGGSGPAPVRRAKRPTSRGPPRRPLGLGVAGHEALQLPDRGLRAGADVDDQPAASRRRPHEGVDGVVDVDEVARLAPVAVDGAGLPGRLGVDEGGHHAARRPLAGAVDVGARPGR